MHERIKKLRKALDLTQEKFANRIGVKRNTIATYESGRNDPVDSVVSLICREFHVSESWLRDGIGEMFVPDPGTELDALAEKFDMSNAEKIFLEKYFKLKREERDGMFSFMVDVVSAIQDSGSAASADAVHGSDLDIDAEVEAYRRQLEAQKKAEAGLSAWNGGDGERENKKEA